MNRELAKLILIAYRPGIDDGSAEEIKEALKLAETDLELKSWFQRQRAWQGAVRDQLREIPVPSDLRSHILASRKIVAPGWRRREFLAAAASVGAVLFVVATVWLWRSGEDEEGFAAYRSRMVRFAVREYRMDIVTNDAVQVRQHLAKQGAPTDYTLPSGLEPGPLVGCAKLSWQNHPVSMICFSTPAKQTLYLFVLDRAAVRESTVPAPTPGITSLHGLKVASWTRANNIYLLAAPISEAELRNLL